MVLSFSGKSPQEVAKKHSLSCANCMAQCAAGKDYPHCLKVNTGDLMPAEIFFLFEVVWHIGSLKCFQRDGIPRGRAGTENKFQWGENT